MTSDLNIDSVVDKLKKEIGNRSLTIAILESRLEAALKEIKDLKGEQAGRAEQLSIGDIDE